ncbi:MAG: hypothetical protein JW860_15585, partial [Sedimentisphaerales bacterium]|nr:hypothetical protein [Sedimentisphaerales bacterium]
TTEPSGAALFINGIEKGTSPELISDIPAGIVVIEARKDALYGKTVQTVGKDVLKVNLVLKESLGNLFIKTSETGIEVILDGSSLGDVGDGFFENINTGTHILELRGKEGYQRNEITISEGQSTKVEVNSADSGRFTYSVPDGVVVSLSGDGFDWICSGNIGELKDVPEGRYTVSAEGDDYETIREVIRMEKGKNYQFFPQMQYSDAYLTRSRLNKEIEITDLLLELESSVSENPNELEESVQALDQLFLDTRNQECVFPELEKRFFDWKQQWENARIEFNRLQKQVNIEQDIINLKTAYGYWQEDLVKEQRRRWLPGVYFGIFGAGALGIGLAVWQEPVIQEKIDTAVDTQVLHNYEFLQNLLIAVSVGSELFVIVGLVGGLDSLFRGIYKKDKVNSIEEKMENLSADIDRLQVELDEVSK